MKKLFAMLGLMLVCSACSDNDEGGTPKITLSSDNPAVTIGADGNSAVIMLTSQGDGNTAVVNIRKNREVSVKSNADWCLAILSNNQITVKALTAATEDRTTTVAIIQGGGSLGELTVKQAAAATISASEGTIDALSFGDTRTLQITTNQAEWSVSSSADWVKTAVEADQLTLTIDPNSGDKRSAAVTLTAGKGSNQATATVTVNQTTGKALIFEYSVLDESTIVLPFSGKINCTITWGDGSENQSFDTTINPMVGTVQHTYAKGGVYNVIIEGTVEQLYSVLGQTNETRSYITAVKQWGDVGLISLESAFFGCGYLKSIPENTSNAFREVTSFKEAFKNTILESIPASLFKGCSKTTNVAFCFTGCKITEIPAGLLDDLTNATECNSLFSSCRQLKSIPAGLFDKMTNAVNLANVFSTDDALTEIPARLFKNLSKATKIEYAFYGCTGLTKVPDELFAGCSSSTTFLSAFFGCTALTSIGNDVFKGCSAVTTYKWVFAGCKELQSVPVNIFDDSKKVTDFSGAFRDAAKLTSESPYTMVEGKKVHIYERSLNTAVFSKPTAYGTCFRACTSLPDWQTISTTYVAWTK